MMKWEYEEINIYPENAKEELNKLGEDGWELVSINLVFGGITHGVAYFKRPLEEKLDGDENTYGFSSDGRIIHTGTISSRQKRLIDVTGKSLKDD